MLNQMLMKHEIKEKIKVRRKEKGIFWDLFLASFQRFQNYLMDSIKKGIILVRLCKSLKAYLNQRD